MRLGVDSLAPRPRDARPTGRPFLPASGGSSAIVPPAELAAGVAAALPALERELDRLGITLASVVPGGGDALTWRHRAGLGREAYGLSIGPRGVVLQVSGSTGAFRGLTTLTQWLRLHRPDETRPRDLEIQGIEIDDAPDFPHRGLLLDISRNRVPTAAELEALIDLLAELKYNQLQLYTEHTFAYEGHRRVWDGWSPLTADEVRRIVAYARERHIGWVPNQASFGHMHRWLVHEPYRRLAEVPEGIPHPFSLDPEPFSLCPTDPGSLTLLEDLYGRLLPLGDGELMNANLDETLDLGLGRSRELCERLGTEEVYLDFVDRVHGLAKAHGKRMMLWGDIILKRPELIHRLPDDAVVLEWGYEADHPFAEDCARFAAAGRELYVCPGTGSWNTFSGRPAEALVNLASAAVHGRRHGATGYLVTDWGDHGHLQPPPVGLPGILAGACFAWRTEDAGTPERLPWAELLDRHVLRDPAEVAGRALLDLGQVQGVTGARSMNGSPLFFALMFAHLPAAERRGLGMTEKSLEKTEERLDRVLADLDGSAMERPDAPLIRDELRWVGDVLRFAGRLAAARLGAGEDLPLEKLPASVRRELAGQLDGIVEGLRPLWLARSRPGGLDASIARLTAIRPRLAPP